MCRPSPETGVAPFRPDVKCCSFFPHLPNFAVGGILNDTSPETDIGRHSVEARIAAKVGVTPFGLDAPATYALLYAQADHAFGVARGLRCPHYIEAGGLCGILAIPKRYLLDVLLSGRAGIRRTGVLAPSPVFAE